MNIVENLGRIDGLDEYIEKQLAEKQKIIDKQHMIINIQWDIIACLMELKGVIEDE